MSAVASRLQPVAVRTYLATGRVVEIGARFGAIDILREVAEPLARNNRYHGQCADEDGNPLSVAEHCVHGADAIIRELSAAGWHPRDVTPVAFAFLVHDGHEAITADPPRNFVAMLSAKFSGVAKHRELIHDAIDEVKEEIDRELGFALDLTPEQRGIVEAMDRRMAAAEIAFAFGAAARRNGLDEPPLDVGLPGLAPPDIGETGIPGFPWDWRFWSWRKASATWMLRYRALTVALEAQR